MSTTPYRWRKLGKVFDPRAVTGRPWLREFAQAPATLLFDDFVRVYFSCRPPPDANGQYASRSAFVDLDRHGLAIIPLLDAWAHRHLFLCARDFQALTPHAELLARDLTTN